MKAGRLLRLSCAAAFRITQILLAVSDRGAHYRWPVVASVTTRRILIVDDNVALAENIAEILGMDGHATDVVATAEDALSKVRPQAPDVLVTDYRLPGLSGADLVRRLRATGLSLCAIVISAYSDEKTIEDARSAGAFFLPKPVDFMLLGGLIRDYES